MAEFLSQFITRPKFYKRAACKGMGFNDFFPGRGQSGLVQKSIKVCENCPVRFDCFDYSLTEKIEYGVWGGTTPEQRLEVTSLGLDTESAWQHLNLE